MNFRERNEHFDASVQLHFSFETMHLGNAFIEAKFELSPTVSRIQYLQLIFMSNCGTTTD